MPYSLRAVLLMGLSAMSAMSALSAGCRKTSSPEDGAARADKADKQEPNKRDGDGVDVVLGPKALEAARLRITRPERRPHRVTVTAAGALDFEPSRVGRVGSSVSGRVGTVAVVPGQRVERGTVLLSLESVDVGRARAELAIARAKLARTVAEVERERLLMDGGGSSERAVLGAQTEHEVALAEVRAAEQHVAVLGATTDRANATVPVLAPLGGVVLELKARVGQPVAPADTLVVVGETARLWLKVDLYERDVGRVHVGDDVRVTTVAYPERAFAGRVDQLGAMLDQERHVLEARIVLDNADGALRPGMTATARILGAPAADAGLAITVPRGALQSVDGQPFVFVERAPGKFEMRGVERGADLEDGIEITRGLEGNENVVVEGSFILKSEALKAQMGAND